jgi:hypothetical protein
LLSPVFALALAFLVVIPEGNLLFPTHHKPGFYKRGCQEKTLHPIRLGKIFF